MGDAPTFEEVGGFGLSFGHAAVLWYGGCAREARVSTQRLSHVSTQRLSYLCT